MKKHLLFLIALAIFMFMSFGFVLAEGEPSISINTSSAFLREVIVDDKEISELVIYKGKNIKLNAEVENVEKLKFKWTSSDTKVAEVTNGTVTGKNPGIADIICSTTLADGKELSTTFRVCVEVAITKLEAKPNKLSIPIGKQIDTPKLQVTPNNATCNTFTWTSEDPSIATVDENGNITGVKAGTAKIYATANEYLEKPKSVSLTITVVQGVDQISLSDTKLIINKGTSQKVTASVQPTDATIQKLAWTSSDPKVATVNNGTITGKGPGVAEITCAATDGSGVYATCNVEIVAPITGATMSEKKVNAFTGKTAPQLSVTVAPKEAKYYDIVWSSSNEAVVKVDQTGQLVTTGGGSATITATVTSQIGAKPVSKKATCKVTVTQPVGNINISGKDEIDLFKGKSQKLTAKVTPSTASNTKVTWSSSDPKIVSVTNAGQISGKKVGKATITCTAADGSGVKDSITVNVRQYVTSVKFNQKSASVTEGKVTRLSATVMPANASFKNLQWSSDSPYIASVDQTGKVTGKRGGSCYITATATDGSKKSAKIKVYVEPINPISLESIGFGVYQYNLLALTVRNESQSKTIKDFDFTMKMYDYGGNLVNSGSFSLGKQVTIGPNRTATIKRNVYGTGQAYKVVITITAVTYSDGTYYRIPSDAQETWSFRR